MFNYFNFIVMKKNWKVILEIAEGQIKVSTNPEIKDYWKKQKAEALKQISLQSKE